MRQLLLGIAPLVLAPVAVAGDSLTIGDKAPAFDISHWVIGDPVTSYEPGKVYVMEFWATWCGPCIYSMPHISELQDHWGDKVTFIGVSDEDLDTVSPWLDKEHPKEGVKYRDRVRYRLTTDPDKSVKKDYFTAAGQSGIPCAFVVGKEGMVEWIGHPMAIDDVLEKVVAGNWDRAAFKVEFDEERRVKGIYRTFSKSFKEAVKAKDLAAQVKLIDKAIGDLPESYHARLTMTKLGVICGVEGHEEATVKLAADLREKNRGNANGLNGLAWKLAGECETKDEALLATALEAALEANELAEGKSAPILDTLARVYFQKGDVKKAIELQEKAVAVADDRMKESLQKVLAEYREAVAQG